MFEIEKLLSLFPDKEIKEILLRSYYLSQEKNKGLSDSLFEQLLLLKTINPKINIILDTTKEKSYFNPNDNVIYLNTSCIETFFHETTHLLSYNFSRFQIPNEYYLFKETFSSSKSNDLMISFLNLCQRRKKSLFEGIDNDMSDVMLNNIAMDSQNVQSNKTNQLDTINRIEDIIDSIFDGWSHTYGLTYIRDNNHIGMESKKLSGHGCEYYFNSNYQFEEILANYQTIKLTNPDNDLFESLKNIIGDEFVSFLDQRCNEICTSFLIKDVNTNNDINTNNIKM